MDSTQLIDLEVNKKVQNWQYVDLMDRDILLFRMILEQKFLTKIHVVNYIFKGKKSYAEIRLRKLKKFGYLKAVKHLLHEPECYLLGNAGVEALKERGHLIGTMGFPVKLGMLPMPQKEIEFAYYAHDVKVTNIRFLFEELGFAKDWHSEKLLKLGVKGDRKVPDGFFRTTNGLGIAFELELHEKSKRRYEKIINKYLTNNRFDYIFYVCGSTTLRYKLIKLTKGSHKTFLFMLYDDLMKHRERAEILGSDPGRLILQDLIGKERDYE